MRIVESWCKVLWRQCLQELYLDKYFIFFILMGGSDRQLRHDYKDPMVMKLLINMFTKLFMFQLN